MNKTILLVNGPNLNLLGTREPELYGKETLADVEKQVEEVVKSANNKLICFQSNHEGEIVDFIQKHGKADYMIVNPGGSTHTSIVLRDAILGVGLPFIEVHISNIHAREEFRKHSYFSDISSGQIVGCGIHGYAMAADLINRRI